MIAGVEKDELSIDLNKFFALPSTMNHELAIFTFSVLSTFDTNQSKKRGKFWSEQQNQPPKLSNQSWQEKKE